MCGIDVSLMQNPSFEVDYSRGTLRAGTRVGPSTPISITARSPLSKNKYTINDLAPIFDHYSRER